MVDSGLQVLTPHNSQIIFIGPPAADCVRRAVDRSPGAEEQHGGACRSGEGFRNLDDNYHDRDRKFLWLC
jgi:hypothetical protein